MLPARLKFTSPRAEVLLELGDLSSADSGWSCMQASRSARRWASLVASLGQQGPLFLDVLLNRLLGQTSRVIDRASLPGQVLGLVHLALPS